MQKIVDYGIDEDTDLEIRGADRLGEFRITFGFEGRVFARGEDTQDSVEDRILDAYDDKLDYSYRSGYNAISISVNRSRRTSVRACAVATLAAIIAYLPLSLLFDARGQEGLLENYVFPLEQMYANAMLMVGAPMTFFSLLKNLTDTYVVSQRDSDVRWLQLRTFATSAFAILVAFVTFFAVSIAVSGVAGEESAFGGSLNRSFADVVTSLITPSIFEPFEAVSPIPLLAVALLCTYALCSTGKYFDALRQAMMACYVLFSRMLHVIIAALPLFCFLAVMDVLLDSGIESLVEMMGYLVIGIACTLLLFATYVVRLRFHGVQVIPFAKKLIPLLRENGIIGSAIDAAPYNVRYCSKVFGMNRAKLERNLPVLAELNLDGNCSILMFYTLLFMFVTATEVSWLNLIGLALLILFLSLGAPNQPGSILIGMLIVTTYLNTSGVICDAIILEAFFGSAQNLINVVGDIVMVAIDDSKEKARAEQ
ncbi:MAG: cation:dicarboxylase symporter family transporter [Eggerthellaceae bacterium]|nr:cation:dicarboxylase symporter family transporter [Eggerthellaceae bacterium]